MSQEPSPVSPDPCPTAPDAPIPPGSPESASSSLVLPMPVKVLASLYLLVGGLALIDTIGTVFQGNFYLGFDVDHGQSRSDEEVRKASQVAVGVHLGIYVIAIPVGVGLLRRSPAWRKLALWAPVAQILVIGLLVYVLYRDRQEFGPIWTATVGPLLGKVVLGVLAALAAAVLVVSVWGVRVLTRNEVKRVFQPVPSSRRFGLLLASALVLLLAILARETGGISLDYCTLSQKAKDSAPRVKDDVVIRVGNDWPIIGSLQGFDQGFDCPCLIEVRGLGREWYRVVTKFNVRRAGEPTDWRISWDCASDAFSGQETAQVSPSLRASADRFVVEVDKPQLSGGYWWPLSKRFTCKYKARIHGEGKYHAFQDEMETEVDVTVSGPCSVHDLKKLLLAQTELKAYNHIVNAVKQAAHVPRQLVERGHRALREEKYDQAIKDFTEAIRLDPNYAQAFHYRGLAWSEKKEYDKAIKDYDQVIRLIRLDPTFDFALAVFHKRRLGLEDRSELEDSEKAHERYFAVVLIGELAEAYLKRGLAWNEKKEYDKAIKEYDQAIQIDPRNTAAFNSRGNAWADKEEYDKAIKDYGEAIRCKDYTPEDEAIFLRNRGLAWYAKKEYDKAIRDYGEAIQLKEGYAVAFYNRAKAWGAKHEYDKAVKDYNEASRLDAGCAIDFINHLLASSHKKDYESAIKDYDEVMRRDPKFVAAFYHRGYAWLLKKKYDRAIKNYDEAIQLDPKYAPAFNGRGFAWTLKKEYDKAIKDYEEAIRLDPKSTLAFSNRAFTWSLKKEYAKAINYYADLIRKGDRSPYAVLFGHLAARQAGDEAAAKRFLKDSAGRLDQAWPYPVIQFLRGDIDEAALLKLATDDDKRIDARCVLGIEDALQGRRAEALAHLRSVKGDANPARYTYMIAAAELERLEQPAEGPKR
jgi:tetratricopeptide (TPR) repeat protein